MHFCVRGQGRPAQVLSFSAQSRPAPVAALCAKTAVSSLAPGLGELGRGARGAASLFLGD
jgi:hypothetical protein